jgi:hypothetical protein
LTYGRAGGGLHKDLVDATHVLAVHHVHAVRTLAGVATAGGAPAGPTRAQVQPAVA